MNQPPCKVAARIDPDDLRRYATEVFVGLGMCEEDGASIADLLVQNDLRGVVSHGTQRIHAYVHQFKNGELNPRPQVSVTQDEGSLLVVDGDGGLGYLPALKAAQLLPDKVKSQGIAMALTRNHGHIGAAGLYSRIVASQGLLCYGTSGHQLQLRSDQLVLRAAGGSPMTFAVPAGEEHPVVLDFGTMHDLYGGSPHVGELFRLAPGLVFRSMGLGAMCQIFGGVLAGVPVDPERARRSFTGANQGSLFIGIDIERFIPLTTFKSEIDDYIQRVRQMQPMPGTPKATLPGGLEWEREEEYAHLGIPYDESGIEALVRVGEELGVEIPRNTYGG